MTSEFGKGQGAPFDDSAKVGYDGARSTSEDGGAQLTMRKLKYLFLRLLSLDFGNMFAVIGKIHKQTGRPRAIIFLDIAWCGFRYLAGYMDYYIFGMYNLNARQRETVLTRGKNDRFIKMLNDSKHWHIVDNKDEFNAKFEKYLRRDWFYINDNEPSFVQWVSGRSAIIVKPRDGTCGKGIERIVPSEHKAEDLYRYLVQNKLTVLEEVVTQHSEMRALHPHSVNTIRVVTVLKHKEPRVVVAFMRIGNGKVVDNFNSGGMVVPVDVKDGTVKFPAIDKAGNLYRRHPLTNVSIEGFTVPLWGEVLELAKKAARELPELGIMGWDVAVTDDGPLLIEGHHYPGHDIYQLPPHTPDGIGLLPLSLIHI